MYRSMKLICSRLIFAVFIGQTTPALADPTPTPATPTPTPPPAAVPIGAEFQVNTYTTSTQFRPSVAVDADGGFVVVWNSYGSAGSDTASYSIQGQRYDASGDAAGAEFQVNTYTTSSQYGLSVGVDAGGNFVVLWASNGSAGSDTSSYSIQGQRYDASGNTVGAEYQVNTYTTGIQFFPAVSVDSAGNSVVVWQSDGSAGTDTDSNSIQGQRYDASGSAIGAEFQVNSYTTSDQGRPSVAADASGNFVVVWQSAGSAGDDTSYRSIQGQRYDAGGSAVGAEFQVNTYTTSSQFGPSVAVDADGDFVVVWDSGWTGGAFDPGIQGQRYGASGNTVGAEFQVNTYTPSGQQYPAVAIDADGNYVVVWHSDGSAGSDTSSESIQGQRYNAVGNALGAEFQVNTYTTSGQQYPAVSIDASGSFVVVWQSAGSAGTDTDSSSTQGQRYGTSAQTPTPTPATPTPTPTPTDGDGDGVPDAADNCITAPNPDQDDSDGDLCGNRCDADYNQDGLVSILDFGIFRTCFAGAFQGICDHAPETLDGLISILDFGVFRQQFVAGVPGPGQSAACDGN